MRKAALFIILFLLVAAPAWAGYDIYLKNGSIIEGVGRYSEIDGQVMFPYMGGTVAIPRADIERIEAVEGLRMGGRTIAPAAPSRLQAAPQAAPQPPQMVIGESPELKSLRERLSNIDRRLEEIEKQTAEYDKLKEEYDHVRLRIEVLFQRGVAKAKSQNGDPAKWYEFLDGQERQWAQLNTLKKKKLEKEVNEKAMEIAPLLQEKQALLSEKEMVGGRIKELGSLY